MKSFLGKNIVRAIAISLIAGATVTVLFPSIARAVPVTYLAIGDSYAYGYQNSTVTLPIILGGGSDGSNQGYVGTFASFLSSYEGSAVNVFNTARPGETSTSYSSGATPTGFEFNTNYGPNFTESQQNLVADEVTKSLNGTINPIKYITVQLGGNDLLSLFPDFNTAPTPNQILAFQTTLTNNLTPLLTGLHTSLPNAQILLLDYPDVFEGSNALTPLQKLAFDTVAQTYGNGTLKAIANSVTGVTFVDTYPPFVGHEDALSYINTPDNGAINYHPNSAGYAVIATSVENAVVIPEPGTLALAGVGIVGIAFGIVRRRRIA